MALGRQIEAPSKVELVLILSAWPFQALSLDEADCAVGKIAQLCIVDEFGREGRIGVVMDGADT